MTKAEWVVVILVLGVAILLCIPTNPCRECRSVIWDETLSEAGQRGFDYCGTLHAAMSGDESALDRLLVFSECTDAASSLGHGCAIVKVLQTLGDDRIAACIRRQSAELRKRIGPIIEAGIDYGMGRNPDEMATLFPSSHNAVMQGRP